jgi:hypothetical protein
MQTDAIRANITPPLQPFQSLALRGLNPYREAVEVPAIRKHTMAQGKR